MAGGNTVKGNDVAATFTSMVEADRQKRKAEQLANSIFGRKQNNSRNQNQNQNKSAGSLASRIGVNKRSSSAYPGPSNPRDTHKNPSGAAARLSLGNRRTASAPRLDKSQRLSAALQRESFTNGASANFHVRNASAQQQQVGQMSIRGIASHTEGPTIVMASNFAPGTTAADIESAMQPIGGAVHNCRILSPRPTVLAEIEFETRAGAENVVNTFNNQIADGRVLYVYIKQGGPTPLLGVGGGQGASIKNTAANAANAAAAPTPAAVTMSGAVETSSAGVPAADADVDMDVEPEPISRPTERREEFNISRDEGRLKQDDYYVDTTGDAHYQDGRYGFAETTEERGREARRYAEDERRYDERRGGRDDRGYGYGGGGGGWGGSSRGYGRARGRGGGGGWRGR